MAKIVKRKKMRRKLSLLKVSVVMFLAAGIFFLFTSLFVRTYNNSLAATKQQIEADIAAVELQNQAVEVELLQLQSSERVTEIAANSGMSIDQNNIVMIADTSADIGE